MRRASNQEKTEMSKGPRKTYDRQTAKFISAVMQNVPEIGTEEMQYWIDHPKQLQRSLRFGLLDLYAAAQNAARVEVGSKSTYKTGTKFVPLPLPKNVKGRNPFETIGVADFMLNFGVEYELFNNTRHDIVLRAYFCTGLDMEFPLEISAKDLFRGGKRIPMFFPLDVVVPMLSDDDYSFCSLIHDIEVQYVNKVIEHVSDDLEVQFSIEERPAGWEIYLTLIKGIASFYSTTFWLDRNEFIERVGKFFKKVPEELLYART
jgi:hypothetical protein